MDNQVFKSLMAILSVIVVAACFFYLHSDAAAKIKTPGFATLNHGGETVKYSPTIGKMEINTVEND